MTASTPALVLEGFELRYRAGFCVGPVDADLSPGLFHLRGGNGSGKTTLLRGVCGELRAQGSRAGQRPRLLA